MIRIGFELVTCQTVSVLPNYVFTMSILWGEQKIPSSIGKDVYHAEGLILPNKRLAATGRIHHLTVHELRSFGLAQTAPCHPIPIPSSVSKPIKVELLLPPGNKLEPIDRKVFALLVKHESDSMKSIPIYLDPQSVHMIEPTQIHLDISLTASFHL